MTWKQFFYPEKYGLRYTPKLVLMRAMVAEGMLWGLLFLLMLPMFACLGFVNGQTVISVLLASWKGTWVCFGPLSFVPLLAYVAVPCYFNRSLACQGKVANGSIATAIRPEQRFSLGQQGQSLVELSLALPVLLIMFLGLMEVGSALYTFQIVANAAREGARYGAKSELYPEEHIALRAQDTARALNLVIPSPLDGSPMLDPEKATVVVSRLTVSYSTEDGYTYELVDQYTEGGDRSSILTEEWLAAAAQDMTDAGWPEGMPNPDVEKIAVEVMYDHPQISGLFSFGQFFPDPVPMHSMTVMRVGGSRIPTCDAYPIAMHTDTVAGKRRGQILGDVYNGSGSGNFGWLRWPERTRAGNEGYLVDSLHNPGLSRTDFENAQDPSDTWLSADDHVWGNTGLSNSADVRAALDDLIDKPIRILVWDTASGSGANGNYHVIGFAWIKITDYRLPGQDRISATFLRMDETCSRTQ